MAPIEPVQRNVVVVRVRIPAALSIVQRHLARAPSLHRALDLHRQRVSGKLDKRTRLTTMMNQRS